MTETINSLAGTPAGDLLALALALLSALAHAIFGAINKGGQDPFLNRGAINIVYSLFALPLVLFVVPWPSPELALVLALAFAVHLVYEVLQATAFHRGAFTVVYPIARGTGPIATAFLAIFIFAEHLRPGQWFGLFVLSGGIAALALANLADKRKQGMPLSDLQAAIGLAIATGVLISIYTTIDAYGIRLADNPFTFIAWFFFLGGFGFPFVALWRLKRYRLQPDYRELALRGFFGAMIAFVSFGAAMLATRVGKVAEVAALRETSIIFATAIGVLIFREKIDARRLGIILTIAAGAILVEIA